MDRSGSSLGAVLKAIPDGKASLDPVMFARRLLEAIGSLHENNLVHGRIDSRRILVTGYSPGTSELKVTLAGIGKVLDCTGNPEFLHMVKKDLTMCAMAVRELELVLRKRSNYKSSGLLKDLLCKLQLVSFRISNCLAPRTTLHTVSITGLFL